ncbi:hypothetical protein IPC1135_29585 [Pseudomonas aeruginosa]|nr:hypothetical protein IPC1135_29585 [Pseudomonas aeruginosa]
MPGQEVIRCSAYVTCWFGYSRR